MLKVHKEEKTVTIKEYARIRRVHPNTVRNKIKAGILKIRQDAPKCRIEIVL